MKESDVFKGVAAASPSVWFPGFSDYMAERNRNASCSPRFILEDMKKERENDPEFKKSVENLEKGVYIFGHSHVQWYYTDEEKGLYMINPGSCGLPLDGIKGNVPYTILLSLKNTPRR